MLSKSEFLVYLEAPMHLWAKTHDCEDIHELSPFTQHLFQQGYEVEHLAQRYLQEVIVPSISGGKLAWQHPYADDSFYARSDAVIYDEAAGAYHIYEIKSGTSVKIENLYDATFQTLVCQAFIPIGSVNIVYLNKDYVRQGELDISKMFVVQDVTETVMEMRKEVLEKRQQALQVTEIEHADLLETCIKPKNCRCVNLCFPGLPDYSIFELMGIRPKMKRKLLDEQILELANIPYEADLKMCQYHQILAVRDNQPFTDDQAIKHYLDHLVYPLYFLDYETYNAAIPLYDGYHPQQQMVFQYSLHKLESPTSELEHFEYVCTESGDPAKFVCEHLLNQIGDSGSVVVWNKAFEVSRNKEMAAIYPEYASKLQNVNDRVFDLMDIFAKGFYIDPQFHGSWSIKHVLPVLCPELSYENMVIAKGDQASMAWWEMMQGSVSPSMVESLLKYCELDTLAMVEIWRYLQQLISPKSDDVSQYVAQPVIPV